MADAKVVWILPCASQEIMEGPEVVSLPGSAVLRYDTEDDGVREARFGGVVAFRFIEFNACGPEHLEAYDKLLDLGLSEWLEEMRRASRENIRDAKHYRIFFDDVGCYDFIARSFHG